MTIDADRLRADLETLSTFGATEAGGVSRPTFSPADLEARRWLAGRCREAGLGYREDPAGNVFMSLPGPVRAPAVWVGSHLDSVPNGGPLDGALGVIAALEVLRALREQGEALHRPVVGVSFADEEGAYRGFLGSKAAVQGVTPDEVESLVGRDGVALGDAMRAAGFDPGAIASARVDPRSVRAYLELHIEQGVVLERAGIPIGVVSHIVGVARTSVAFEGRADHAGTTPMGLRRDALRGAATLLDGLAHLPADVGAPDGVVTCGRIAVEPGADNIVPARAVLHLDIRDRDAGAMEAIEREVAIRAEEAAKLHDLEVRCTRSSWTPPTPLDAAIQRVSCAAAEELGYRYRVMPSGAGHDAQVVAPAIATGMLFVPSIEGRSHSPLEATAWEDVARGTRVLHGVVRRLASEEVGRT